MSSNIHSVPETVLVEPLMPDVDTERSDWPERAIAVVATVVGVMIVAAIAVVIGVA
jgi:hypothetical protein